MKTHVLYTALINFAIELNLYSKKEIIYFMVVDDLIPNKGDSLAVYPNYEKEVMTFPCYLVLSLFCEKRLNTPDFIIINP